MFKVEKRGLKWESKCDKADLRRASVSETQDESGLEMERVASTRSHRCCLFLKRFLAVGPKIAGSVARGIAFAEVVENMFFLSGMRC